MALVAGVFWTIFGKEGWKGLFAWIVLASLKAHAHGDWTSSCSLVLEVDRAPLGHATKKGIKNVRQP
jgi:hypothetical protein